MFINVTVILDVMRASHFSTRRLQVKLALDWKVATMSEVKLILLLLLVTKGEHTLFIIF